MLLLRVTEVNNSPVRLEKDRFAQLPIRIGRNPLNDVCLNNTLVSAFHARIEDIGGKLYLRDMGSRNGVFVRSADSTLPVQIAPDTPLDLASVEFRFFLASVYQIKVEFVAGDAPLRPSMVNGQVLGNPNMLANVPSPLRPLPDLPGAAGYAAANPQHADARGWAHAAPGAPAGSQQQPAPGRSAPPRTQFLNLELDAMALQGLRELAGSLTPGCPLETTGDVARFITKLHDSIDVFCRCFIPLRDGYAQFVSSLDLQQGAFQRSMNRSPATSALEAASTPDEIAMALLNPRDQNFDAPAAIEGILADLMLHQVALLDGVMQGVKALLDQLSPENIEASLQAENRLGLFSSGNRARFQEYRERFERLSDEKQAFSLIFGREFTEVYRQYWRKQSDGSADQRLRTDRPRG